MTDAKYGALVAAYKAAESEKDTSPEALDIWLDLGRKLSGARRERQDARWHAHLGDQYAAAQFERGVDEGLL